MEIVGELARKTREATQTSKERVLSKERSEKHMLSEEVSVELEAEPAIISNFEIDFPE